MVTLASFLPLLDAFTFGLTEYIRTDKDKEPSSGELKPRRVTSGTEEVYPLRQTGYSACRESGQEANKKTKHEKEERPSRLEGEVFWKNAPYC